jgi:hypothetical protein
VRGALGLPCRNGRTVLKPARLTTKTREAATTYAVRSSVLVEDDVVLEEAEVAELELLALDAAAWWWWLPW